MICFVRLLKADRTRLAARCHFRSHVGEPIQRPYKRKREDKLPRGEEEMSKKKMIVFVVAVSILSAVVSTAINIITNPTAFNQFVEAVNWRPTKYRDVYSTTARGWRSVDPAEISQNIDRYALLSVSTKQREGETTAGIFGVLWTSPDLVWATTKVVLVDSAGIQTVIRQENTEIDVGLVTHFMLDGVKPGRYQVVLEFTSPLYKTFTKATDFFSVP